MTWNHCVSRLRVSASFPLIRFAQRMSSQEVEGNFSEAQKKTFIAVADVVVVFFVGILRSTSALLTTNEVLVNADLVPIKTDSHLQTGNYVTLLFTGAILVGCSVRPVFFALCVLLQVIAVFAPPEAWGR